jgi:molybdopterin/thiamine biosynthesis adenylyltransferase
MTPEHAAAIAGPARESAAHAILRPLDTSILTRGRVVSIGLGGIGLFLNRTVAVFFAGLCQAMNGDGRIDMLLCDGDAFALENAYRMDIPNFGNKAAVLAEELLERFDSPGLNIRWLGEYVTTDNVERIIQNGDCVLLACDNHATRQLVNRRCSGGQLTDVVLISGGNDGVEEGQRGTYGNVQVYVRAGGRDITAPLDRYHPEIAAPADKSPGEMSCVEAAAAGVPQLVFTNLAMASAMCNALLRLLMPHEDEPLYDEVSLDIFDATCLPHWFSPAGPR